LRSCMAFSTFLLAFLLYLAISPHLPWIVYQSYSSLVTLDHHTSPAKTDKFLWQK
jgi:hypothetical protein